VTMADVCTALDGRLVAGAGARDREVTGGYVSDLLSDVIAHAEEGDVWLTLQRHVNVVAVARLKNLAGIVLVAGREPDAETTARAEAERVPIVTTPLASFEAAGRLYQLGVRGRAHPESLRA
jgi:hypothetical protein